jgi:hypothetical protein
MLQLNLKRNDVQGLKMESSVPQSDRDQQNMAVFAVPEVTLEGQCETIYTVQKPGKPFEQDSEQSSKFNVTKNVNFNKCKRTADVLYGFNVNPSQELRCLKCIRQQQQQKTQGEIESPRYDQLKITHCQKECQSNQLSQDQEIERSTVAQYELVGRPEKYAIKRASIVSQYVCKAQNPTAQNTVSQVVAMSELVFKDQQSGANLVPAVKKQSEKEEGVMYSNEWDVDEKRFYM